MQVIVYKIDGEPCTISPLETVTEILDENGDPTGETTSTDNLQQLIAEMPEGTDYDLVDAAEAESWLAANKSPAELAAKRKAEILARLAEIDTASVRPLRAIAQGEAVQADHDKLAALDSEAADLRAELAGLG